MKSWCFRRRRPILSIIVVAYDMERALPRTLQSLSHGYQRGVVAEEYEIIIVDNGSPQPLSEDVVHSFGPNFRYRILRNASHSPAPAVNTGASMARGTLVSVLVDGARMLTPGFVQFVLAAFRMYPQAVVAAPAWHLGPEYQGVSIGKGYDENEEDRLLESIGWPDDGYRLFDVGVPAPNSSGGCFLPLRECNSVVVSRALFRELRGYDLSFSSPGGGLVNHDFYRRALQHPGTKLVMLPGEGSFHQVHGGIATNTSNHLRKERLQVWWKEYERIRGEPFQPFNKPPILLGRASLGALGFLTMSANKAIQDAQADINC